MVAILEPFQKLNAKTSVMRRTLKLSKSSQQRRPARNGKCWTLLLKHYSMLEAKETSFKGGSNPCCIRELGELRIS